MHCKQTCDCSAAKRGTRHSLANPEDEDRIRYVEPDVGQVVKARSQAKQFTIQHVREPGERMPSVNCGCRKRPANVSPRKPRQYVAIRHHVIPIVEVDEIEPNRPQVKSQR